MHLEQDELKGIIEAFLERPVPEDWLKWDAQAGIISLWRDES